MEFHAGMIMSHVILADEINRTSPNPVQPFGSYGRASGNGRWKTYPVPEPFIVLATQIR